LAFRKEKNIEFIVIIFGVEGRGGRKHTKQAFRKRREVFIMKLECQYLRIKLQLTICIDK